MAGTFVSGHWVTKEGAQGSFVEAWKDFLGWTRQEVGGLRWAILCRDGEDARRFISVAEWDSPERRDAWRAHSDFPTHMGRCRAACEEFHGAGYDLAAAVGARHPPPP